MSANYRPAISALSFTVAGVMCLFSAYLTVQSAQDIAPKTMARGRVVQAQDDRPVKVVSLSTSVSNRR